MSSYFERKIYAHKTASIILNNKSDHFINTLAMVLSVECTLRAIGLLSWLVLVGIQIRSPLNLRSQNRWDNFK
ncbi:MAG: hypothetical protein ACJAXN_001352 [Psychromonas sp.]|jgi:hypothetical protein